MIGRAEIAHYHPLMAVAGGLLSWLWTTALGAVVLRGMRLPIRGALGLAAEFLLGVIVLSTVVQILAWNHVSNAANLQLLSILLVLLTLTRIPGWIKSAGHALAAFRSRPFTIYVIPLWLLALILLIAASGPASRSDETAYHVLVGTRVVQDGALLYYPLPWEATVIPQFAWHYSLVPLFATLGTVPAGVVSVLATIVLAFCVNELVARQSGSHALGAAAAICVLAGGYSVSLLTTLGPHAFVGLSTFAATAAIGWSEDFRVRYGLKGWAILFAVGLAGMLAGKVTMVPLAAVVTLVALRDIAKEPVSPGAKWQCAGFVVALPALAFALPAAADWLATGSPLGILTAHTLHARAIFDDEAMRTYESTRDLFSGGFKWRFELAYWNAAIVLGCLLSLRDGSRARRRRWWLMGGVQLLTILLLLPKEIRHMSGLQYTLFCAGLIEAARLWASRDRAVSAIPLCTTLIALPWVVLTCWIGSIYLPLFFGKMSAEAFLGRYCALEVDYEKLDKVLPSDAKLLMGHSMTDVQQAGWYARPPTLYAPRPVLYHTSEVRPDDHLFLMFLGAGVAGDSGIIPFDPWMPAGFRVGRRVYFNPSARFFPSRTPSSEVSLAPLDVYELVKSR